MVNAAVIALLSGPLTRSADNTPGKRPNSCSLREQFDQWQDVPDWNVDIVQHQDRRKNLDENPDVMGNAAQPGTLAQMPQAAFGHVRPPFSLKLESILAGRFCIHDKSRGPLYTMRHGREHLDRRTTDCVCEKSWLPGIRCPTIEALSPGKIGAGGARVPGFWRLALHVSARGRTTGSRGVPIA